MYEFRKLSIYGIVLAVTVGVFIFVACLKSGMYTRVTEVGPVMLGVVGVACFIAGVLVGLVRK